MTIWLPLFSAVAFLALSVLALAPALRPRGGPPDRLRLRLFAVTLSLFAYQCTELGKALSVLGAWAWADAAAAAMLVPFIVDFVLTFIGAARLLRPVRFAFHAYFGGIAVVSLGPLVGLATDFPNGERWALLLLCGMVPALALFTFVLLRHLRQASGEERARTRLLLLALWVGTVGSITDLVGIAGAPVAHISNYALLCAALLLAMTSLRLRLLEDVTRLATVQALVVSVFAILLLVVLFRWIGHHVALLALASTVVVLIVIVGVRPMLAAREQLLHHATLGRMASQMAHDVRNPLAAIRGAAQLLLVEVDGANSSPKDPAITREMLALIVEQTSRIARIVDDYRRLGRIDVHAVELSVTELCESCVRSARTGFLGERRLVSKIATDLHCFGDFDLLSVAIDNVLRNAMEAMEGMEESAIITLVADQCEQPEGFLFIEVTDEGAGMDARTLERAMEDFFTTKTQGSGIGLPMVRRIVEAHGGRIRLRSKCKQGTTVRLEVPGRGPRHEDAELEHAFDPEGLV